MAGINYLRIGFPPVHLHNRTITPFVHLMSAPSVNAKLAYAGNNADHLTRLRESGAFALPSNINNPGDAIRNAKIKPADWFYFGNDTETLFTSLMAKHPDCQAIVATNAGNAPVHDWEVNYAKDQVSPLASKDFEIGDKPMLTGRQYFCATYGQIQGIGIGHVEFKGNAPLDSEIEIAVGGRPLVNANKAVSLDEVLMESISDPRHVVILPEIDLGNGTFMPLGIRSLQEQIRNNETTSIIERIKAGAPFLIDLEKERDCCGPLSVPQIEQALLALGYPREAYEFKGNVLYLKLRYNPYRHTFWAMRGGEIFIGIINNNLEANNGIEHPTFYDRVLKPVGLTIAQLQEYLIGELGVEEAVLMGNGRDCRLLLSEAPHRQSQVKRYQDHDIRPAISAGLIALII